MLYTEYESGDEKTTGTSRHDSKTTETMLLATKRSIISRKKNEISVPLSLLEERTLQRFRTVIAIRLLAKLFVRRTYVSMSALDQFF